MKGSRWLFAAGALGGLGVALGAFGAHGLEGRLSADMLAIYDTGSHYHLVHSVALLGVAWAAAHRPESSWPDRAGWLMTVGILIFSGSLYLLAVTGVAILGAITPFGGISLIAGWVALAMAGRGR